MKKTSRGFNVYSEFKDSNQNIIRIQKSSSAMKECCWIFIESKDGSGLFFDKATNEFHAHSPHLTKTQAKILIKGLSKFIKDIE